jgi:hypothetical protein
MTRRSRRWHRNRPQYSTTLHLPIGLAVRPGVGGCHRGWGTGGNSRTGGWRPRPPLDPPAWPTFGASDPHTSFIFYFFILNLKRPHCPLGLRPHPPKIATAQPLVAVRPCLFVNGCGDPRGPPTPSGRVLTAYLHTVMLSRPVHAPFRRISAPSIFVLLMPLLDVLRTFVQPRQYTPYPALVVYSPAVGA